MNVEGKVKIEFDLQDLYSLAYTISHSLEDKIENHYNSLQQEKDGESLFFDCEQLLLRLMKLFYQVSGYGDVYDGYINQFKKQFDKKRKEREDEK